MQQQKNAVIDWLFYSFSMTIRLLFTVDISVHTHTIITSVQDICLL